MNDPDRQTEGRGEISLALLRKRSAAESQTVQLLRRALFQAKAQLAVLQVLNPGLVDNGTTDQTIEIIQRALRGDLSILGFW